MKSAQRAADAAQAFATNWIASNIEAGPFSCDDRPIYVDPIRLFRSDAEQAGISAADLEHSIGPVPAFIAKAYTDAAAKWRADLGR